MNSKFVQNSYNYGIEIDKDIFEECWEFKRPETSNHIRTNRGVYFHHGIYISDDEVIHFTGTDADNVLNWSKNEVISTSLVEFLRGDELEVKNYTNEEMQDLYPVDHIINYARACLGDRGYNLVFNNCEHFANECTLGRFRSLQVERVLSAIFMFTSKIDPIIIKDGGKDMGLFSTFGGLLKNFFKSDKGVNTRNTNHSNYAYEPDKLRIAEIEANTRIKLAGMDRERIDLMNKAELERMEVNLDCQIALEEAKAKGMTVMVQSIILMQEKLNEIAEARLKIIEFGSMEIIKEIEGIYSEIGDKIKKEDDLYNEEKLPNLLTLLSKYEPGSDLYDLYKKRVETDMTIQAQHYQMELSQLSERQRLILSSFLKDKELILTQSYEASLALNDMKNSTGQSLLNSEKNTQSLIGKAIE